MTDCRSVVVITPASYFGEDPKFESWAWRPVILTELLLFSLLTLVRCWYQYRIL